MSVTRLSSYFSFKAKSYFWVSSSLLLKFLQFLLVILILFLVFPPFSFIDTLLKVALLVSFSTSSFCCREQSFLFYHYFFFTLVLSTFSILFYLFLFVLSFRFYFNVHFFFFSFSIFKGFISLYLSPFQRVLLILTSIFITGTVGFYRLSNRVSKGSSILYRRLLPL